MRGGVCAPHGCSWSQVGAGWRKAPPPSPLTLADPLGADLPLAEWAGGLTGSGPGQECWHPLSTFRQKNPTCKEGEVMPVGQPASSVWPQLPDPDRTGSLKTILRVEQESRTQVDRGHFLYMVIPSLHIIIWS